MLEKSIGAAGVARGQSDTDALIRSLYLPDSVRFPQRTLTSVTLFLNVGQSSRPFQTSPLPLRRKIAEWHSPRRLSQYSSMTHSVSKPYRVLLEKLILLASLK